MKYYVTQVIHTFFIMSMSILIAGCSGQPRLQYIIPDHYTGFLVAQFDCPYGQQLAQQGAYIPLIFTDEGTACIGNAYDNAYLPGIWQNETVQTKTGTNVRHITNPDAVTGYALVYVTMIEIRHGSTGEGATTTFSVLWVGSMDVLQAMSARERTEQLDRFLRDHFDVYSKRE